MQHYVLYVLYSVVWINLSLISQTTAIRNDSAATAKAGLLQGSLNMP